MAVVCALLSTSLLFRRVAAAANRAADALNCVNRKNNRKYLSVALGRKCAPQRHDDAK